MTQQAFQQQGWNQPQQGWDQPQQPAYSHHAHPANGGAVSQGWPEDVAPARDLGTSFNLSGNNGNAFPFETIGDTVTGSILSMEEQQQTDLQTGLPKRFDNGQPMMMYKVRLQTQLRDPQNPVDDGVRSIYLRGSMKPESQSSLSAVITAVQQATGSTNLQTGGLLALSYVGNGQARQRGFNAPKLYAAKYQAPTMNLATQSAPVQPAPAQPMQAPIQQVPQPMQAPIQQVQPAGLSPEMIAAMANMQNAGLTSNDPAPF